MSSGRSHGQTTFGGRRVTTEYQPGDALESTCNPSAMRRHARARVAGMRRGGCSAPEESSGSVGVGGSISMLDHTVSQIPQAGVIEPPASQHVDRSMDVLQYATAFVAVVVAILLAVLH